MFMCKIMCCGCYHFAYAWTTVKIIFIFNIICLSCTHLYAIRKLCRLQHVNFISFLIVHVLNGAG
ncbi:hypothetical protein WN944_010235 [Citrus x changshan-huyou]|uniref:Uncharacterized protein n=1 Tax=Citrus x changshan-huyou TaxID=2935761 RepID=A0AAP0MRA7_9ROSI